MYIEVKDVGVDAGIIMICDKRYYDKYEGKIDSRLSKVVPLDPGSYNIKWKIPDSWRGPLEGSGVVNVDSGSLIVSDPCYCIKDKLWIEWLNIIKYGNKPEEETIIINSMGGDGRYEVQLEIQPSGN